MFNGSHMAIVTQLFMSGSTSTSSIASTMIASTMPRVSVVIVVTFSGRGCLMAAVTDMDVNSVIGFESHNLSVERIHCVAYVQCQKFVLGLIRV